MPFGQVIPVTGLNLGFLGEVSRSGERVITARQVLSTATAGPNFGDPMVIVPGSDSGSWQSVANFIAQGSTFASAAQFAAIAVRNVKTLLKYTTLGNIGSQQLGNYDPGAMGEGLERGSSVVQINNGTPVSQSPAYIRTVFNGAIAAGVVGGWEASPDGSATAAANAGNTGNATMSAVTTGALAQSGKYSVIFQTATAYTVYDPTGKLVGTGVNGTPFAGGQVVFTTTAGGTPMVRGDGFTITSTQLTIAIPDVIFRTGVLDGNGCAEVTILSRQAA